jgi:hypothetical protein
MGDKFDVINGALVRIGADEITSFDDGTTEADVASRLYPNTLNDLLSRYPWRFMMGQAQLARHFDAPSAKWTASYQIPSEAEIIKAVMIHGQPILFDRYADKIYCDAVESDEVFLDYVAKVDESRFPGYFSTLLEFELAANFAIPVGDRSDLAEAYEKKSLRHFSLAKNLDSQGRTAARMKTGRFRRVRWGYGYGS